jgi:hypothetical protein
MQCACGCPRKTAHVQLNSCTLGEEACSTAQRCIALAERPCHVVCLQGGGGIFLGGTSTLLARDSSFTHNLAPGPEADLLAATGSGGAVMLAEGASLTAIGCIWEANQARMYGGAVFAVTYGTATFTDCTLHGNVARIGGGGGAILVGNRARLVVKDSRLFSNHVRLTGSAMLATGGAIAATDSANASLANVDLYNNTAGNAGGAFAVLSTATMQVNSSRMWANTAKCGGGGAAAVFSSAMVNISHSQFWNNTGRNLAGAVGVWDRGQVFLLACNLSNNSASSHGGALYVAGVSTAAVADSILLGNQVGRPEPSSCSVQQGQLFQAPSLGDAMSCGGAVSVGGPTFMGTLFLNSTRVESNIAPIAGGVCALAPGNTSWGNQPVRVFLVGNTTFEGNQGRGPGADVYIMPAVMLSIPPCGCNVNTSSYSIFWSIRCEMGEYLDYTSGTCVSCGATSYKLTAGGARDPETCQRCPATAECYGGALLVAEPKFYHTHGVNRAGGSVPTCHLDTLIR